MLTNKIKGSGYFMFTSAGSCFTRKCDKVASVSDMVLASRSVDDTCIKKGNSLFVVSIIDNRQVHRVR